MEQLVDEHFHTDDIEPDNRQDEGEQPPHRALVTALPRERLTVHSPT